MIGIGLAMLLLLGSAQTASMQTLRERIETLVQAIEPQVADVPVTSAAQLLKANPPPLLLDVRSPAERAVSIIPGALTEIGVPPAGTRVVIYCTIGLRSGIRARELRTQGLDAVNLRGGILSWLAEGGTVVDTQGRPTRAVHVYGRRWDAVPDDVDAVW